jgi:holo-[acyl-carrier protein] synthase
MIEGLGMDLVEIARIERAMRRPGFLERVLTKQERELDSTPRFVAGRWAAKEAAKKCLPGLRSWHDIQVLRRSDGAPVLQVNGLDEGRRLWVTITHERTHAAATVLLEGPGP